MNPPSQPILHTNYVWFLPALLSFYAFERWNHVEIFIPRFDWLESCAISFVCVHVHTRVFFFFTSVSTCKVWTWHYLPSTLFPSVISFSPFYSFIVIRKKQYTLLNYFLHSFQDAVISPTLLVYFFSLLSYTHLQSDKRNSLLAQFYSHIFLNIFFPFWNAIFLPLW